MCGLFQVIQKSGPIDRDRFRRALASMHHRGPDQSGELFLEVPVHGAAGGQVVHMAFGHQRLAILDLSDKSRQPFVADGDVLLYNGEVYNYRELNAGLRARGVVLHTDGDTETLLRSLQLEGEPALARFNGMWAYSLYRASEGCLRLARDRYGKKPLFFYQDENVLCVSSTIHAIQVYLGRKFALRRDVLVNYLVYGELYPSGTVQTHYDGICQVLPGHAATFDLASWALRQQPYFAFYDEALAGRQADDDPGALVELLKDAVRLRLVSDRPVGLLLSGGIDSTLVLATLYALGMQDQCKVYMGEVGRSEDYRYAKLCADKLGIQAETVVLDYDSNTFERFLQVCRHQEKPVSLNGSSMGMPQMYEVIAAQGVPVVLDGTGGDEIFGGYWQRQFPYAVRDARRDGNWGWLRRQLAGEAGENAVKSHLWRSFLPPGLLAGQRRMKEQLKALANPFFQADFARVMATLPSDPLADLSLTFPQAMCADTAPGGRLGEWLWHNDRNSMMSSVEGRSPLLDYRLNRYLYTPYERKFVDCWNKHELRTAFDALAPLPSQWRRQKQGFRWDGKHFLAHNKDNILALVRENRSLDGLVDIPRLVAVVDRQPKLLKSSFVKQVLAISGVEQALSSGL